MPRRVLQTMYVTLHLMLLYHDHVAREIDRAHPLVERLNEGTGFVVPKPEDDSMSLEGLAQLRAQAIARDICLTLHPDDVARVKRMHEMAATTISQLMELLANELPQEVALKWAESKLLKEDWSIARQQLDHGLSLAVVDTHLLLVTGNKTAAYDAIASLRFPGNAVTFTHDHAGVRLVSRGTVAT